MRIIAGKAKGLIIKAPKGMTTRPTSDKVREAIFSTINDKITDAFVLDLFAGSGALGIEALSRGASQAVFVDSSYKAIETIKENLKYVDLYNQAVIKRKKASDFLRTYKDSAFGLIFIDAPYRIRLINLVDIIGKAKDHLLDEGLIVVEHTSKINLKEYFKVINYKKYGQTAVSYLAKES